AKKALVKMRMPSNFLIFTRKFYLSGRRIPREYSIDSSQFNRHQALQIDYGITIIMTTYRWPLHHDER
ncbi:hypothetical protein, partial [Vibrio vulnificus]|uniref:hypothetical protein n=1 Tax=Vibrio vulnificus TaxID=672 RepID=UPI00057D307C